MSNWYENSSENNNPAVSTRIRLARNITNLPFPCRMNNNQLKELNETVKTAIAKSNTPFSNKLRYIAMDDIPKNEVYSMVERHIISREFAANCSGRGIIISDDESICIMIGEEDHLRIQVISSGLNLKDTYDIAEQLDSLLCSQLDFAFNEKLGYLTECPTNLGTGLRASIMLHLPALESSNKIALLSDSVGKIGFTVRGMYGEGTKALASMYQVSNQITLGIGEKSAIENLETIAKQLVEKEMLEREMLDKLLLEDKIYRAFGILKNARIISSEEMMNYLSLIKLGCGMGIITIEPAVMKLLIEGQPYMLMKKKGEITANERDYYRAQMLRESL